MSISLLRVFIAALLCQTLLIPAVIADPKAKLGTWEMTVSLQGLAVSVPPQKVRYCITKDSFAPKKTTQQKDCNFKWSTAGDTVKSEMRCVSGAWGKTSITYYWDSMKGTQDIQMPGNSHVMKSTLEGRWLQATCKK